MIGARFALSVRQTASTDELILEALSRLEALQTDVGSIRTSLDELTCQMASNGTQLDTLVAESRWSRAQRAQRPAWSPPPESHALWPPPLPPPAALAALAAACLLLSSQRGRRTAALAIRRVPASLLLGLQLLAGSTALACSTVDAARAHMLPAQLARLLPDVQRARRVAAVVLVLTSAALPAKAALHLHAPPRRESARGGFHGP